MEQFYHLWLGHPAAAWVAIGALLLAVEVLSGSGWLLWPAAAALVPAAVTTFWLRDEIGGQWVIFALTAIALTWLGRRYLKRWPQTPSDINDARAAMIGRRGEVTSVAAHNQCRVMVAGKEWAAESDGQPVTGAQVEVTAVVGGARLHVRPAT